MVTNEGNGNGLQAVASEVMNLDKVEGALLGTALGDALGVPLEGLSPLAIQRLTSGRLDRFFPFGVGVVSDDTEQSALVAQSIAFHPTDPDACVKAFRRSLGLWLLRMPWGIGLATLRASMRILLGLRRSGVASAGNGAAMRAAIVGVVYAEPRHRRSLSRLLAEVTHTDPRAVQGASLSEMLVRLAGGHERDPFVVAQGTHRAGACPGGTPRTSFPRHRPCWGRSSAARGLHTVPFHPSSCQ